MTRYVQKPGRVESTCCRRRHLQQYQRAAFRKRVPIRALLLVLAALILCTASATTEELPPTGGTIALSGDSPTVSTVGLTTGELLNVVLTPDGLDLAVRVLGPAGRELWAANDAPSTTLEEKVWLVAPAAGTYRVELTSHDGAPGTVHVASVVQRPATAADRLRVRAERQLQIARRALRTRGEGLLADAREVLDEAATSFAELSLPRRLVTAKLLAAMVERVQGDPAASRARAEEARRAAVAADYPVGEGAALNSLAIGWWASGDMEQAHSAAAAAVAAYRRAGYRLGEAEALNTVGLTASRLGDLDEAEEAYRQAAGLFTEIGNLGGLLYARNNLAVVRLERGEYDAAIATFEEVADALAARGDDAARATVLMNVGSVLNDLGDLDRARRHFERALTLLHGLGAPAREAAVLTNLGSNAVLAGDSDTARGDYRRALTLYRQAGDRAGEATALHSLGDLALREERFAAARDTLLEALTIRRELALPRDVASTLTSLGEADIALARLPAAEGELAEATTITTTLGDPEGEAVARDQLARLALARGDLATAAAEADHAIALIESLRARLASDTLRSTYLGMQRGLFELAVTLAVRRARDDPGGGHLERAFALSEQAHARSLLDLLAPDRPAIAAALDPALAARTARLEQDIARLQRQLIDLRQDETPDANAVTSTEQRLLATVDEWQSARAGALRSGSPLVSLLDPPLAGTDRVATLLEHGTVLLEYVVGDDTSTLLLVDRTGVAAFPLPSAGELTPLVHTLRDELAQPAARVSGAYLRAARRLFELLVAPAAPRLEGADELVIVPDGPLHLLPFEVLLTAPPAPPIPGSSPTSCDNGESATHSRPASWPSSRNDPPAPARGTWSRWPIPPAARSRRRPATSAPCSSTPAGGARAASPRRAARPPASPGSSPPGAPACSRVRRPPSRR